MAKVSSYLPVIPSLMDYFLMTDVSNNNKTAGATIQSLVQLINGVNGQNVLQFRYVNETEEELSTIEDGTFLTDTLSGNPLMFTKLHFSKFSLFPLDITEFFEKISTLENVTIKLSNPQNPNNFFKFNITSCTIEEEYVVLEVNAAENFYLGELTNNTIYSPTFDIKGSSQNNIPIRKYVYYTQINPTLNQIRSAINSVAEYDITDENIVFFIVLPLRGPAVEGYIPPVRKYVLLNKGKGSYGFGQTPIEIDDLELLYVTSATIEDIENDPRTQIEDYGNIGNSTISIAVSNANPARVLQDYADGYVLAKCIRNSVPETYLFLGIGGVYGLLELQTTDASFTLLSGQAPSVLTNLSQLVNDVPFVTVQEFESTLLDYVRVNGNQIINDVKEFSESPLVPTATGPNGAVNFGQVTAMISEKPDYEEVILQTEKAAPNGVATLDGNAKIPLSQINDALLGNVNYQGIYNATTNTPSLTTIRPKGQYFIVGTAGTQFGITFEIGDWIISNGASYNKVDNTDAVSSVAGLVGVITAASLKAVLDNITNVAIQNGSGVTQFNITDKVLFKGFSFDVPNKLISADPLVGGVIFVSSTGNDSTAQLENRNKPYLTLNAAIIAYWANPSIDYIEIISASSFTTNLILNDGTANRKFDLRSQKACSVTVTTVTGYHPSPAVQEARYDLPFATLIFAPTTSGGGFGNSLLTMNVNILQFNSTFLPSDGNSGLVNITANIINLNATINGLFVGTGGPRTVNITAKTINFRGANTKITKEFIILNLNFDLITHDNTFLLNTTVFTSSNITHGSITSVAPYAGGAFTYMSGGGTVVNYKTGANITSNIGFSMNNVSGSLKVSGNASYPNSDALVWSHNTTTNTVEISNSVITCKTFTTDRMQSKFIISNSTIIVTADKFADSEQPGGGQTFPANQFTFIGNNFIIGNTDGFNLIRTDNFWVQNNKPSVNTTKGVLYTNGKFDRSKVDIIEKPLNQYYDTTDRVTVRVDEKLEIVNVALDSSKIYLINGDITFLAGEFVILPATGLTLAAQGFDIGKLKKNVAGEAIVKSAVGGSGNFITNNITYESGAGKAFELTDATGNNAIELNDVNFQNCAELGTINGYRQFTGTTCGVYGCNDGFTLSGTWNGFKLTNTNVSGFSSTGTLIKEGSSLSFKNRLYLDLNLIFTAGSKLLNLFSANFQKPKSLQIRNTQVVIDNVLDITGEVATLLVPNISNSDAVSDWRVNTGFANSPEEPTGIDTTKIEVFVNDAAASAGGVPLRGTYIEASTGYFKTRLV